MRRHSVQGASGKISTCENSEMSISETGFIGQSVTEYVMLS